MDDTVKKRSVATTTAIGSLLAAGSAHGAIQFFDSSNAFTASLGGTGVNWDIDGNGLNDASFDEVFPGYFLINPIDGGFSVLTTSANPGSLAPLASGYLVSAARSFAPNLSFYSGGNSDFEQFSSGVAANFGFRFVDNGILDDPDTFYGWANATVIKDVSGFVSITINEWAYEDTPDQAIQVGAIPEPANVATGLGLLALGAAGLRRWRGARRAN